MGEVWLARHKKLGTAAAVKFLSSALTREPKFRERFYQEARTQAQLHHPHIAQVLERIVLKALAKDPNNRYVSCGEFARAIGDFQSDKPVVETISADCLGLMTMILLS